MMKYQDNLEIHNFKSPILSEEAKILMYHNKNNKSKEAMMIYLEEITLILVVEHQFQVINNMLMILRYKIREFMFIQNVQNKMFMKKRDQLEDIFQNQNIKILKDQQVRNMYNQWNILNQKCVLVHIHITFQVIFIEALKVFQK